MILFSTLNIAFLRLSKYATAGVYTNQQAHNLSEITFRLTNIFKDENDSWKRSSKMGDIKYKDSFKNFVDFLEEYSNIDRIKETNFYNDNEEIQNYIQFQKPYFDKMNKLIINNVPFFKCVVGNLLMLLEQLKDSRRIVWTNHLDMLCKMIYEFEPYTDNENIEMQTLNIFKRQQHMEFNRRFEYILKESVYIILQNLQNDISKAAQMWDGFIGNSALLLIEGFKLADTMMVYNMSLKNKDIKTQTTKIISTYKQQFEKLQRQTVDYLKYLISYNKLEYLDNPIPYITPLEMLNPYDIPYSRLTSIVKNQKAFSKWIKFSHKLKYNKYFQNPGLNSLIDFLGSFIELKDIKNTYLYKNSRNILWYVWLQEDYYECRKKLSDKENPFFKKVFRNMFMILENLGLNYKKDLSNFFTRCEIFRIFNAGDYKNKRKFDEIKFNIEYFHGNILKGELNYYMIEKLEYLESSKIEKENASYIILKNCYEVLRAGLSLAILYMNNSKSLTPWAEEIAPDIVYSYKKKSEALKTAIEQYMDYFAFNDPFIYSGRPINGALLCRC